METYDFYAPSRVLFGPGQVSRLHELKMPGKKALLVTSNGKSTILNGSLDKVQKELEMAGCTSVLFNQISANPLKETVELGAKTIRENGCDFVVALGGGSVMDAGKVIAMLAPQPSDDLWDYATGATGKNITPPNPVLPWIAITTSAGTGSEVDSGGVITNTATNEKINVGRMPSMMALYSIVDPELMLTVPPVFTAYQGFDALFHNIEGYLSNKHNIMADMIQLTAVENIATYLPRCVKDGKDLEARTHVAFANTLGGYSMDLTGCISEHSLEHALSAYHNKLPHGAGLIMLSLSYFSYWIDRGVCPERFVRLAKALGKADAEKPADFLTALGDLQRACGVADLKMSDFGIRKEEAHTLAENAKATMGRLFLNDPDDLSVDDACAIIEKAYR